MQSARVHFREVSREFHSFGDCCTVEAVRVITLTPLNAKKYYMRISPKMSHTGIAQSPLSIYRQGKADLSQQAPWHGAAISGLSCRRSQVLYPAPAGELCMHSFLHPPFFPFWRVFPLRVRVNTGTDFGSEFVIKQRMEPTISYALLN